MSDWFTVETIDNDTFALVNISIEKKPYTIWQTR